MPGSDLYLSNFEVVNGNKKKMKRNKIKQAQKGNSRVRRDMTNKRAKNMLKYQEW